MARPATRPAWPGSGRAGHPMSYRLRPIALQGSPIPAFPHPGKVKRPNIDRPPMSSDEFQLRTWSVRLTNLESGRTPVHDNAGPLVLDAAPLRPAPQDAGSSRHARREDRSRWIALVVLCAGMLMIVLDMTVVNVALPSIRADLGFSQSSLAWVVNAYLIAF